MNKIIASSTEKNNLYIYNFIIIGILSWIVAALDIIWVIGFPLGIFNISILYIWSAFFYAFAIWFKWKWILAIYLGLIIAALFTWFHAFVPLGALWNTFWGVIILLWFKYMNLNSSFSKIKYYIGYITLVIMANIISSIRTIIILNKAGLIPSEAIKPAIYWWIWWWLIVWIIIGIPLLKFLSPVVNKLPFIHNK